MMRVRGDDGAAICVVSRGLSEGEGKGEGEGFDDKQFRQQWACDNQLPIDTRITMPKFTPR